MLYLKSTVGGPKRMQAASTRNSLPIVYCRTSSCIHDELCIANIALVRDLNCILRDRRIDSRPKGQLLYIICHLLILQLVNNVVHFNISLVQH